MLRKLAVYVLRNIICSHIDMCHSMELRIVVTSTHSYSSDPPPPSASGLTEPGASNDAANIEAKHTEIGTSSMVQR